MPSFDKERYEKWKRERKTINSNGQYERWVAQNRGADITADVQSRLQSWIDEHNSFLKDYSDRFGGRNADYSFVDYVGDADAWSQNATVRGDALKNTANQLLSDIGRYGYLFGDDYVKEVTQALNSGLELYSGAVDAAKKDADYWSRFAVTDAQRLAGAATAEQVYNNWRRYKSGNGDDNTFFRRAMEEIEGKFAVEEFAKKATSLGGLPSSVEEHANTWNAVMAELQPSKQASGFFTPDGKLIPVLTPDVQKQFENQRKEGFQKYFAPEGKEKTQTPQIQLLTPDLIRYMEAERKSGYTPINTTPNTWGTSGPFADGFAWKDIPAAAFGTAVDFGANFLGGIAEMGENLFDFAEGVQNWTGGGPFDDRYRFLHGMPTSQELIERDLINGEKDIKDAVYGFTGFDVDKNSLLGEKSEGLVGSVGQLLGTAALQAGGIPWWLTTGMTSFGGEYESATLQGATPSQAGWSALVSACAEVLTEKISGGIKFGGSATLDDMLTEKLASSISNKFIRKLALKGLNVVGEGMEEMLTEEIGIFGRWLTYQTDENLMELLRSEEAMEAKMDAFIGGGILGGLSQVDASAMRQTDTQTDSVISEWVGVTNAVGRPLNSYPVGKQNAIRAFVGAVDQKIKSFAESVKSGDKTFRREKISDVSERAVEDISNLLGIDVSGYTNNINTNGMQHIINRHGENGVHDTTMANDNDIARVGWVLENYDAVEIVEDDGKQTYSAEFRDSNNNPAPQIRFIKKIDGTYYVVEAACENKYKKLWVQSAYLQKNEDVTQVPTADQEVSHERHAQSELASPSSLTSISDSVAGVNGENADPLAQLAREAVEARYAEEEGNSAEGRAILNDEAVDVVDIDTAGGGKVTVKLADGRSVDATALEYEDSGEAELWRVIGQYAEDADSARALLQEYRNGDLDAYKYARGVEEAFLFGKLNLSPKEMEIKGSMVNDLSAAQRKEAYTQGRRAGEKQAQQRQNKVASDKKGNDTPAEQARNGRKKGQLHFEGDRDSLTSRQKVSLQTCEIVAKALGIDIHVFESEVNSEGKHVGDNGWYDPKDGSIHIDLYSGQNGEGVMVFTLAHELTHFIRDWSPKKFNVLSGFLAEQYAQKGQSVADLVRDQQRRAEEDGRKLSFEEAHEEWVADSMEQMLTDGTIVEKLAMLQAKDKSLVEKIKTFLNDFGKRLKDAYKSLDPRTKEGRIVADMVDGVAELQNLFADALLDAGENFQTAEKNTTGEGGVRFMSREDSTRIKQQIDAVSEQLNKMDVVVSIVSDDFAGMRDSDIAKKLEQEFSKFGNRVERQNFGVILLEYKQLNKALNYLKLPGEKAALLTVPRVLKRGIQADFHTKHKDRGVDSYTFAAPVEINGKRGNVGVVVQRVTGTNRFKTLRILLPNGKAFEFVKNNEADSTTGSSSEHQGSEGIPIESASKTSIRNPDGIVKENDSTEKRTSSRSGDVSDRTMLVDLFEQMVTDSNEHKALQNYKKNMDRMMALEEKIDRLAEEIKRVSFGEGPRNMEYLDNLKWQRKQAVAELNRYDNILLNLEKSGVLRSMIERNRAVAIDKSYKKAREYYRESRRQAVERHDKAQVRQQIRKDVQRLDSLLNKGTKEKNVKLELQDFAGAALRTAKGTFLKNYNEYDMVRNGVNVTMSREQKTVFTRAQALLKELDQIWEQKDIEPGPNSIHEKWDPEENLRRDDHEEALKKELAKNMAVLREAGIFRVENELMEDSIADQLMDELMAAYSALKDSESAHVREVFSTAIYSHMEGVKKFLAGKAVKDMTAIELGKLKDMYRMVLHTITTSNDLFAQKRKADVRVLGEEVIGQLRTPGKEMTAEILDTLKKMGWANLKPETALELIGSDTLTEMMQGLYHGEDTYARDLEQARQYAEEQGKKYGRNKWDMKKSVSFAGTKITLGQAMSLYAYTKRKQAQGHLEGEGFTHSSNVRIEGVLGKLPIKLSYIMNATRTHIVPKGAYADVAALLTTEQRKYVDAMQDYLSKVMGAKGNEVSMQMYGVKLFEETMYFPLKTASEYREEALGATAGEVKLRNTGFTQKTVDGASNPIVLDDFESVWAGHVDKMSLYHGFVLPMEDFDRVYNYRHAVEEGITDAEGEVYKTKLVDTNESVKVDIENKMGKAANAYIEDFMKQLNGGVRGDSTEKLFGGMVRNFKKTAVLGSLSVSVQQPTAFIRAMAYLDVRDVGNPNDFLGKAGKPEAGILKEMYKYAPVALMKKIGGFDPGLGRTTQEYVLADKKGITGALDKFLGKFPEKMDEWTWSYIWVCTKRQIHRQNPDLKINSKEFLEKVGERFSKIIRDTQVYDSVLTKSQIMRSKNVFMQMATAFMNEPTTSMDMYIRSTLQAKRDKIKKSQAARTYAAVVSSQILTAAVVAFVYALRDDDEDETYWEKYLSAAIGKAWENTMPWYSIPFVKDIFSIFDGYSVERSDMSLITDLYQGWQKLQSDKATPWEKTEAFAGSILNVFGIPLKNVSRDVRGIYNTVNTWITGGVEKTGAGLRYAALEGLTGKKASKEEQLQNAVAENDAKHILRVMASYSTEESAVSAFRSAVKAAYLEGNVTEEQAAEFLQAYAGDDAADTRKKITVWKFKGRHPESELSDGKILDYVEFAEPAGIGLETYTRYAEKTTGLKSEKDEDGKPVSGSKRKKVLAVIDSLPLTSTQKDALFFAEGYAESTLDEVPWH